MTVRLFVEDGDLIDNVSDDPRVPEDRRREVAARAAGLAERGLSDDFMRAFWAETDRLVAAACDELGIPGPAERGGGWPEWVDPSRFGEYVRDEGSGAVTVACYDRWSDGEACLHLVRLGRESAEWQLGRVRSGECRSMGDDLLGNFDYEAYGTSDGPARLAEMRAALDGVLSWTPEPAWRASRLEG